MLPQEKHGPVLHGSAAEAARTAFSLPEGDVVTATTDPEHPDKLLITGEDRFLGYSLMMGARAALIGMGAALTDIQAQLLETLLPM